MHTPAIIRRLNKPLLAVLTVAMAGLIFISLAKPCGPLTLDLVSVAPIPASGTGLPDQWITLKVRNVGSNTIHFMGDFKVQRRVRGQWQPPETCSILDPRSLASGGILEGVALTAPAGTETCRITLEYRTGLRPYCRAYFFLDRHGVRRKFPTLSKWVLKQIAAHEGVRRTTFELTLPKGV